MSKFVTLDALDSPQTLRNQHPTSPRQSAFIAQSRHQINEILDGKDPRLLLIVGPCSIHEISSAKEYALKLSELSHEVSDSFLIVMRTYFEKPRSVLGWKGMLYDPYLDDSNDLSAGLQQARQLLLTLADMELPTATEFLDPITARFIEDLISWGCIGARTAESQIHRQLASGLDMPVAFKNSTSGNIDVAIKGVLAANAPHTYFGVNDHGHVAVVRTKGNAQAHIVLRGGENQPNYDASSIANALRQLEKVHLPQRLIIDCAHGNSYRQYSEQGNVFRDVLQQHIQGNFSIRGLAFESHLNSGNQNISSDPTKLQYAVSLTDPCLDWNSTENLIRWGAEQLEKNRLESTLNSACAK